MNDIGKLLLMAGLLLAAVGALMMVSGRAPVGRLPGDIVWRRGGTTIYVPIVTCIILSIVLSLILSLFRR